jgi:NADH dehydrogenase/NADH:ubiquinone oxidoreductase subunit G
LLYTVQPHGLTHKKWFSTLVYTNVISFVTHKPTNFASDTLIPVQTFYEKDGYLVNLEGRIRKFYKSVTPPKGVLSLESFFVTLLRAQVQPTKWLDTLKNMWRFNEEVVVTKNIEKIMLFSNNFFYNYAEPSIFLIMTPFSKSISDFYSTDLLSANSVTMGESSLFLNKRRNFSSK